MAPLQQMIWLWATQLTLISWAVLDSCPVGQFAILTVPAIFRDFARY